MPVTRRTSSYQTNSNVARTSFVQCREHMKCSGSVARNVSGFWVSYGATREPGTLLTGNPEDEIRSGLH